MISTYEAERVRRGELAGMSDDLEEGRIVHFPNAPIRLPDPSDQDFLRGSLPGRVRQKNVSFHHEAGRVVGLKGEGEVAARTERILREHAAEVQAFLRRAVPTLVPGWTVGTTSFRPIEERGRGLRPHASNELVHVDAGAYGATNGDRILRFFVNLNPSEDRVWASRGTFAELFERYGKEAGVAGASLRRGRLDRARSGLLRGLSRVGLPLARVLDSSPYDRAMRRFHNYMKDSAEFQASPEGRRELRFGPFSAWMVFTDTVSHACLSGRFALVSTFLIPLANCARPEHAPLRILAGRGRGRAPAAVSG